MKQLIFCLMLFCFGCHGLLFSQDYVQTQKMLEAKYSYVSLDKENNCFEVELNGKKGICDLRGREIIAPDKYTYIYTYGVKDGYYKVKIGDNKENVRFWLGEPLTETINLMTWTDKLGEYKIKAEFNNDVLSKFECPSK